MFKGNELKELTLSHSANAEMQASWLAPSPLECVYSFVWFKWQAVEDAASLEPLDIKLVSVVCHHLVSFGGYFQKLLKHGFVALVLIPC